MRLSNYAIDKTVAPKLSKLNKCGASQLADKPISLQDKFILNMILRANISNPCRQYFFNFIRRVGNALFEHENARLALEDYLLLDRRDTFVKYFLAIHHFEVCISQAYQACELMRSFGKSFGKGNIYKKDDGSVLDKLNKIYNDSKHAEGIIRKGSLNEDYTIPMWITNEGLESPRAFLSFQELKEVLLEESSIANKIADLSIFKITNSNEKSER